MDLEVLNRVNLDRGNKGKRYLHAIREMFARLYIFYSVFIELFYKVILFYNINIHIGLNLFT